MTDAEPIPEGFFQVVLTVKSNLVLPARELRIVRIARIMRVNYCNHILNMIPRPKAGLKPYATTNIIYHMNVKRIISKQFRKPNGIPGKIVSKLMIKGNSREYTKMLDELDIKPGDRIFEIGYGPGIGIDQICSNYNCFVSGIDFSELMFKQASERNKKHISNNKTDLFCGDFLDFEITAGSYDKVFCLNVIYFWDHLQIPFTKIRSSLKEGGLFCFSMAAKDHLDKIPFASESVFNKYSIEDVIDQLKLAGYTDINYTFDWVYFVKCRK